MQRTLDRESRIFDAGIEMQSDGHLAVLGTRVIDRIAGLKQQAGAPAQVSILETV